MHRSRVSFKHAGALNFPTFLTNKSRGVSVSPNDLHYEGRKVIVHGFPIGIQPQEFKDRLAMEETQRELSTLRRDFQGQKVIVGVDRLDYIKGIPQKLKAFDRFLTENPDWLGKVALIQLAIPTRADVSTYQKLREGCCRQIPR